jgi:hypothetical protein
MPRCQQPSQITTYCSRYIYETSLVSFKISFLGRLVASSLLDLGLLDSIFFDIWPSSLHTIGYVTIIVPTGMKNILLPTSTHALLQLLLEYSSSLLILRPLMSCLLLYLGGTNVLASRATTS